MAYYKSSQGRDPVNIQTDIELTPQLLDNAGHSYKELERIAVEGSEDQRDILLTWGYRALPAFVWENLVQAADRGYLLD